MKITVTETNGISLNFTREEWDEIIKNVERLDVMPKEEEPKEVLKDPFARMGKMNIFFIKELHSFYGNSVFGVKSAKLKELQKKYYVDQPLQVFDSLQGRGGCIVTRSSTNRLEKVQLTINAKFL